MSDIELNDQQIYALYEMEHWWYSGIEPTFELSGAAGTGKTTLIRYFIERIDLELSQCAFVAFQGKAATQMARNGLPAQTIHSLIYKYEEKIETDEFGKPIKLKNGKLKKKIYFKLRERLDPDIKLIVLDEGSTVSEEISRDLLSFKIPLIVLGDLNQLPPVIGKPFFLKKPDYILTQIMRQSEDDPIVWLSQRVINNEPLQFGVYGKSSVIRKSDLNEFILNKSDVVLTATNNLRFKVNDLFRTHIKKIDKLDIPNEGEKIICRKNNWSRSIEKVIFLTNGLSGTVEDVDIYSFTGDEITIDFKPDFTKKSFRNVNIDYKRLFSNNQNMDEMQRSNLLTFNVNQFEFAYAITVHLSQGSQFKNVVFLNEMMRMDKELRRKLMYTAITRAMESITIVL